ncbi:DUF6314 family protein [Streptomyces sp. HNM0574]|uniref:DUF6314 family protein n=1 Tax=Streptomyces sp. HNM0574 TaxID=2714954 RepID=UPI00146EE2B4|nr:DUF6314 family protein [Streptomyces sp. HNM0574]NLU69320.1 hypothetical protein [Streptomyces sp. HNM0574]
MPAQPHPVPDTLGYLAGRWSVRRRLRDDASGGAGHFTGTAVFRQPADGRWLHEEDGVLEWNGVRNDARRTLRLDALPDGTAEVSFADGRPFHRLDLRTGTWHAHHPCGRDHYEGTFTVVSPAEWHLRWRVRGPAKDQLLSTVYRRVPTGT